MKNQISDIAIIGMAGRYPKADSPAALWDHILANTNLASLLKGDQGKPYYVNRYFAVNRIASFNHKRFKCTPLEAELTDPQHRILLTCAHQALLGAGYPNEPSHLKFGVFATTSISTYLLNVLMESEFYKKDEINYPILIGNDKDFVATKIAYKLNLTGPALTIQCACSSSLVAMHQACQSLLQEECDLTIVGAVSISIPQEQGYLYKEGGILSPDGVCRPFDAFANGTIKGNGCSVLILKRLKDAIQDRDQIYAVVKGTAINNDGANKVGYTAPSILGQSTCIQRALSASGVTPDAIDYIETHGTGTKLGDLIELSALNRVFGNVKKKIPLGSLKANIGHLDVAAGISSVIKLAYVLKNGIVPPIQHFHKLNSDLKDVSYAFDFPTELKKNDLINGSVSSFGIGGTNACAILSKYEAENRETCLPHSDREVLDETEFWVYPKRRLVQTDGEEILNEIIEIWTEAIGDSSIDENSSYADLGGDSLTVLDILDRIKKRLSITLTLSDFKRDLTPRELTKWIQSQREPSLFAQIRKSTNGIRSIFLFHPAGGTTFCYDFLAQSLKGDYNMFAIDLSSYYSQFKTMEELASYYLREIRKLQPQGPYWLGGYSFGGNLSYEIAVQLQKMGEFVPKIILFDSHLPEAYTSLSGPEIHYQDAFSEILNYFPQNNSLNGELLNHFYNKWIFSHQLLKRHKQKEPIVSDILLFEAIEKENNAILDKLNIACLDKELWKRRTKGSFRKIRVSGNHYTIFDKDRVAHLSGYFDEEVMR